MRHVLPFFTVALVVCMAAGYSLAADFNVNSTFDAVDASVGDGICAAADGKCTLRAAVQESNSAKDSKNTINLPAGTYKLTIEGENLPGVDKNAAAKGDLDIAFKSVDIIGSGASSTIIDANGIDSAFSIQYWWSLPVVTLSKVTITGAGDRGIVNAGELTISEGIITGNFASKGGGIYNNRKLTIDKTVVSKNAASIGGGIYITNSDTAIVSITDSAIIDNIATQYAGAVSNGGSLSISNSTVSGNTSEDMAPGIYNDLGMLVVESSTIAGNKSASDNPYSSCGGGLYNNDSLGATSFIHNTIIAGNVCIMSNDCYGTIQSNGYNLVGDVGTRCTIAGDGTDKDIYNVDSGIGPLADNGGFTPTHAIARNSPARDAADPDNCPSADQRGVGRPIPAGGRCDIGAFEFSCGDGVVQALAMERCDDGNLDSGDGCSNICQPEEELPEEELPEDEPPEDEPPESDGDDDDQTPPEDDGSGAQDAGGSTEPPPDEDPEEPPAGGAAASGCSLNPNFTK